MHLTAEGKISTVLRGCKYNFKLNIKKFIYKTLKISTTNKTYLHKLTKIVLYSIHFEHICGDIDQVTCWIMKVQGSSLQRKQGLITMGIFVFFKFTRECYEVD